TATLLPFSLFSVQAAGQGTPVTVTVLVALLVCLIPTTIGALLSAIGIAGMDRMIQKNVIAMSGRAVEAAGDVDVLLLDKTGTITLGNRHATAFFPADGVNESALADAIAAHVERLGGSVPLQLRGIVDRIAKEGATPLVVSDGATVLGAIQLKDIVKGGIRERFGELRRMGIRTIMITGDNPLTAAAIAAEAGVDDFLAEATPEAKLKLI